MGDMLGGLVTGIGDIASKAVSQEGLPITLPLLGAGVGGAVAGGKGALEGALAGGAAGQLFGTGPLAFFGPGDQSVVGSAFGPSASVGTPVPSSVPMGASVSPTAAGASPAASAFTPDSFTSTVFGREYGGGIPTAANIGTGAGAVGGGEPLGVGGGAASAGGPTTSGGRFLANPSAGTAFDVLAKNPNLALAAGGLGASLFKGQGKVPGLDNLQRQANQLSSEGSQLTQALLSGKLPPGAQATVDSIVEQNQARVRQTFANMGLSGSTEETTALNQAAMEGTKIAFQIASSMAQQGLGETQTGAELLKTIMATQMQQDAELQNALIGFANVAAGGRGVQLSVTS